MVKRCDTIVFEDQYDVFLFIFFNR